LNSGKNTAGTTDTNIIIPGILSDGNNGGFRTVVKNKLNNRIKISIDVLI
jgi:hypothetical protein